MIIVTCIGPIALDDDSPVYFALALGAPKAAPVAAPTRTAALDALAKKLPKNTPIHCDPALADVARSHGWLPTPLPRAELEFTALTAIGLAHGPMISKLPDLDIQRELAEAAVAFARARPWERFKGDVPYSVRLSTGGARPMSVFGQRGEEWGIGLFASDADFERFTQGDRSRTNSVSCLTTFEDTGLAHAVEAAWGVAITPRYLLLRDGRLQAARADDARVLVAALRAVTAVARAGTTGVGTCTFLGKTVTATVECDLPDLDPSLGARTAEHPFFEQSRALRPWLMSFAFAHGYTPVPHDDAGGLRDFVHFFRGPWARRLLAEATTDVANVTRHVEQCERFRLVLFESLAARHGRLAGIDRLTGEQLVIDHPGLADQASPHDCWLLAVVREGDRWLAAAAREGLVPLPTVFAATDAVRARFGLTLPATLEAAEALIALTAPPPAPVETPRNEDGHPLQLSHDVYRVGRDLDAVFAALSTERALAYGDEGLLFATRLSNPKHPLWRRTVIGTIELPDPDQPALVVHANSFERLDEIRAILEGALPAGCRFIQRVKKPVDALLDPELALDLQHLPEKNPDSDSIELSEALEVRAELWRRHRAALASPDEAVRERARRDAYATIAQAPEEWAIKLSRATGVGLTGEWIGPDEAWLAHGAGLTMSQALDALVAPALDDFESGDADMAADPFRVAWAVWDAGRSGKPRPEQIALARQKLRPDGSNRPRDQGALVQRLSRSSPNLAIAEELVPWLLERFDAFFAFDRRHIDRIDVVPSERADGVYCEAHCTPPSAILGVWEDVDLAHDDEWKRIPRAWRREIIADWLISGCEAPFEGTIDQMVARAVAVSEAIFASASNPVREACAAIEACQIDHANAVWMLARVDVGRADTEAQMRELVRVVRAARGALG